MINEYYNEAFIGKYHLGRFYFTINTERTKAEVGLSENQAELAIDKQKLLQREFLSTIIHEYIHYLHEISTVVGNMGLGMDITLRSLFSNWIEPDLAWAISNGNSSNESLNRYSSIRVAKDMLEGDRQDAIIGKFINVKRIDSKSEDIFLLGEKEDTLVTSVYQTPIIYFDSINSSIIREEHLSFGKFFLYEGIAYELDRIVDQKLHQRASIEDSHKGTEYTVMRRVAQYIFPDIEKKVYITLGVLALQYPECGVAFIEMLNEVKEKSNLGIDQNITLDEIKNKVSQLLLDKLQEFEEQQFEYQSILLGRRQLYKAMSYLTNQMNQLYVERIENPSFEVDLIFNGKIDDLLTKAQICDYIYQFSDASEYMRDFLGTNLSIDDSYALKVLLSHEHFVFTHQNKSTTWVESKRKVKCPFFTCCHNPYRLQHESICAEKPWRIFEISLASHKEYCWYGQGVLESKGQNELPIQTLNKKLTSSEINQITKILNKQIEQSEQNFHSISLNLSEEHRIHWQTSLRIGHIVNKYFNQIEELINTPYVGRNSHSINFLDWLQSHINPKTENLNVQELLLVYFEEYMKSLQRDGERESEKSAGLDNTLNNYNFQKFVVENYRLELNEYLSIHLSQEDYEFQQNINKEEIGSSFPTQE